MSLKLPPRTGLALCEIALDEEMDSDTILIVGEFLWDLPVNLLNILTIILYYYGYFTLLGFLVCNIWVAYLVVDRVVFGNLADRFDFAIVLVLNLILFPVRVVLELPETVRRLMRRLAFIAIDDVWPVLVRLAMLADHVFWWWVVVSCYAGWGFLLWLMILQLVLIFTAR